MTPRGSDPRALLPPLYVVCDADVCSGAGLSATSFAKACFEAGARFLQVRAKGTPGGRFLELTTEIIGLARTSGARVVVNDRADIARMAGADGVHVGQEDLSPSAARSIVGEEALVGLSTHTVQQIDRAVREPVSYVAVGPVFDTGTKATGYEPVGLELVRYAARQAAAHGLPLVAIGGITLERAQLVLDAGARSVAVITDLLTGGDPAIRTREFLVRLVSRGG